MMMKNMRLLVLILSLWAGVNHSGAQKAEWGRTDYQGAPWVTNASRPYHITQGLNGRHLSLWASHGCYFDRNEGRWRWQRPALFSTNEDLFTQTIVVPYLMPMLENAGAIVYSPRERDWQRHEVIVDNDQHAVLVGYQEQSYRHQWVTAPYQGFAMHHGVYHDGENPFRAGTARMAMTTRSKHRQSQIVWQPNLPEAGRYAVYVSYQTVEGSIDDAHYTVWHKGEATEYRVNQQMGGGTWVYLGTFEFDRGASLYNCVILTNQSAQKGGLVTADAVRFGGGMGNIERGGEMSGMPRCLEGARYWAQWAGIPYKMYSTRQGTNDYADDINARSLTTNWLMGRSVYAPDSAGLCVPIELALAVHSDAGYNKPDGQGVYGSLSICTTQQGAPTLGAGHSRQMSYHLAQQLLENTTRDLSQAYGQWNARHLYDRNYSETRLPLVPSAIIETLSHQNFGDMRYGQDPHFRFTLARSIYKTLLRYINTAHHERSVVTPLAPTHFRIEWTGKAGEVRLSWTPTEDSQEPSAHPTDYVVYTAMGDGDFDNGTVVGSTSHTLRLQPSTLYSFRITALNRGGQSFPTEVLSALYEPGANQTVLVVNGFHRLSSPAITQQGFDLSQDIGVSYGRTAGWLGQQQVFDTSRIGIEDSTGLGYSTQELAGHFIAGNDFNYVRTHADAIRSAQRYHILSCSADVLHEMPLRDYALIDLILGLECNDGHSLVPYKTFTPAMQTTIQQYTAQGGCLLVSGAYIGSDMQQPSEQSFLSQTLKCRYAGINQSLSNAITGMGTQFTYHRALNEQHYAATRTDVLMPCDEQAFSAMTYADGSSAAVAYQGHDYRAFVMGYPLECIQSETQRNAIMRGIIQYLIP